MTEWRQALIDDSNNSSNPNKNACTLAICEALMVADRVRYLHTIGDVERAIKKRFKLRELTSQYQDWTISNSRSYLREDTNELKALAYYVFTYMDGQGHVILLGKNGKTLVDTMNCYDGYDSRRIEIISAILPK